MEGSVFEAKGWAVCTAEGVPLIKTVSETRRAAIVNWLYAHAGVQVFKSNTDEDVEAGWRAYSKREAVRVREVTVTMGPESTT